MKRFMKSKKGIGLVVVVVALAVAGGAYAYVTAGGSGSGTATSGTASSITLHATFAAAPFPGQSTDVTFKGDNANTAATLVGTIHYSSVTSSNSACQAVITANPGQFSMADVPSSTTIPALTPGYALTGTGSLVWADSVTQDQTACTGVPITLNVTSTTP